MKIKFNDGKEIKFKRFGKIWLAKNAIWDGTELDGSMEELRVLKAKVAEWFDKNASKKFAKRFTARLPLWKEVEHLPFKDQVAYGTKKTDRIAEYLLGDEEYSRPVICRVGLSRNGYGWLYCNAGGDCSYTGPIRLCLEEKQ